MSSFLLKLLREEDYSLLLLVAVAGEDLDGSQPARRRKKKRFQKRDASGDDLEVPTDSAPKWGECSSGQLSCILLFFFFFLLPWVLNSREVILLHSPLLLKL